MYNTSFVVIVWCRKAPVNVSNVNAGSARNTPRPATNDTKNPKGLKWEYQIAAGNAGWRSQFRFAVHVIWSRVPDLWSLGRFAHHENISIQMDVGEHRGCP